MVCMDNDFCLGHEYSLKKKRQAEKLKFKIKTAARGESMSFIVLPEAKKDPIRTLEIFWM